MLNYYVCVLINIIELIIILSIDIIINYLVLIIRLDK